jgi:hypothetical protein
MYETKGWIDVVSDKNTMDTFYAMPEKQKRGSAGYTKRNTDV